MADTMTIDHIDVRLAALGCHDHSCLIHKPDGVGTNGGCQCIKGMTSSDRRRMGQALQLLRLKIQTLENAALQRGAP